MNEDEKMLIIHLFCLYFLLLSSFFFIFASVCRFETSRVAVEMTKCQKNYILCICRLVLCWIFSPIHLFSCEGLVLVWISLEKLAISVVIIVGQRFHSQISTTHFSLKIAKFPDIFSNVFLILIWAQCLQIRSLTWAIRIGAL